MGREMKKSKVVIRATRHLIEDHRNNSCSCDLTEGGQGFCIAGQLDEGVISVEEFFAEIFPEALPCNQL